MVFLACAALGIKWPQFFAFHMLDICVQNSNVRNVLKSVTTNGKSILLTLFLVVVLAYIYAMIGFMAFRTLFTSDTSTSCTSLYYCLMSTVSFSIWGGAGVAGATTSLSVDDKLFWPDYIYTISFYIFIIVITLNIVLGIILDTFGQLREEKNNIEEDMASKCFICSIEADRFQRDAVGFDNHTKYEHDTWQYLNFFIHLKSKPVTEYTNSEYYIYKQNKKHEIDYFPVNKAISLLNTKGVQEE